MQNSRHSNHTTLLGGLALAMALAVSAPHARANVYATNIKLDGALGHNAEVRVGGNVTISYILNEPATMGVTVNILSGASVVRSISIVSGNPGTAMGLNSVVWNGKDNLSNNVSAGAYSVSVTAAAVGFTNWTQTSVDTNPGNYVYSPRGIAVNINANSPWYGRIFAGNAAKGPTAGSATPTPGDVDGILKLNADGSFADEGQSTGGYTWVDDGYDDSPHFLRYAMDDRIYALDWTGSGVVVGCDNLMTTNEMVLSANNYSSNPYNGSFTYGWDHFDVTDPGTSNALIFLGDNDFPSAGLWCWHMTNGIADPADTTGQFVIQTGGDLSLLPSGGFMMDESSNIFVAQDRSNAGDSSERAMVFTNWDRTSTLYTGTAWQVGGADDTFRGNFDMALDSRTNPKLIAVPQSVSGGIRVLNAADGSTVTNNTPGDLYSSQVLSNLDGAIAPAFTNVNNYDGAVWDAVGNLYGVCATAQRVRAFSPPSGANQATTVAVEQVAIVQPPVIASLSFGGGNVTINFTAGATDPASAFLLWSAGVVKGPYATVPGATATQVSPGVFKFVVPVAAGAPQQYYRVSR